MIHTMHTIAFMKGMHYAFLRRDKAYRMQNLCKRRYKKITTV
jgi:hypothetical protein